MIYIADLNAEFVGKSLNFQMISVDTENCMRSFSVCSSGRLKLNAIFVNLEDKEKQKQFTHDPNVCEA